jgi:hypothetical protein
MIRPYFLRMDLLFYHSKHISYIKIIDFHSLVIKEVKNYLKHLTVGCLQQLDFQDLEESNYYMIKLFPREIMGRIEMNYSLEYKKIKIYLKTSYKLTKLNNILN